MKQALNVILVQVVFAEHTLTVCKGFVFYKVTNLVPMLKKKVDMSRHVQVLEKNEFQYHQFHLLGPY